MQICIKYARNQNKDIVFFVKLQYILQAKILLINCNQKLENMQSLSQKNVQQKLCSRLHWMPTSFVSVLPYRTQSNGHLRCHTLCVLDWHYTSRPSGYGFKTYVLQFIILCWYSPFSSLQKDSVSIPFLWWMHFVTAVIHNCWLAENTVIWSSISFECCC